MSAITPAADTDAGPALAALHPKHRDDPSRIGARPDVRRVLGAGLRLDPRLSRRAGSARRSVRRILCLEAGSDLDRGRDPGVSDRYRARAPCPRDPTGRAGCLARLCRGGPSRGPRLGSVYPHHVGLREHGDVHRRDPQDGNRRHPLPDGHPALRRRANRLGRPPLSPTAHRLDVADVRPLLHPPDDHRDHLVAPWSKE